MADSSSRNEAISVKEHLNIIKRNSIKTIEGKITRYILGTKTVLDGRLKRVAFGEKDKSKPYRTILLVGETGVGKSTIVNTMVNYMLGVSSEDKIWCEIIETQEEQTDYQTNAVIVYDVFIERSPFSLTVIDTPGFGKTEDIEEDSYVAESLNELFRSNDGVHEIDAVCLVVSSNTTRLTGVQLYVFDAVLSLFGNDVEKNIVVFFTHAASKPTNAIKAVKEAKVLCAKTDKGEPVYFRFNNCHCEDFNDEETLNNYKSAWDQINQSMENIVAFVNDIQSVSLTKTTTVLKTRKQLTASIFNLKDRITMAELKQVELEQTKAALQQNEKEKKEQNFEFTVDEPYKDKVPIEYSWWHFRSKEATCCSVCEENCHYPGCWWVRDLSRCSVISEGKCTVCTGKCPHNDHVKEGKIYVVKTRKVTKTKKDLKKKYDELTEQTTGLISKLTSEKEEQEREKIRLVDVCYECVITLDTLALKGHSVCILQHMDFLIEKVKETDKYERVQKLEEVKKRAEAEDHKLLKFIQRYWR